MTDGEIALIARIALHCDYPGARGDLAPRWICDLATDGTITSDHDHDRLRHAGLITWGSRGWQLTEIGWQALDAVEPA